MKTIIIIFFLGLVACSSVPNQKIEKPVITGKFTWIEWQKQAKWKSYLAENYTIPNEKKELIISFLDLQKEKLLLFAGSWCKDSETEVPKIIKIFEEIGVKSDNFTLYGVDKAKREKEGIAEHYKIEKVPTLIVLRNNIEIGRIIEFPQLTWEDDIFLILSNK